MDVIQNESLRLGLSLCERYVRQSRSGPALRHPGEPQHANEWVRDHDAHQFERGGLLPMAVFLTKNAPGLRTSPVKRGNWVCEERSRRTHSAAAGRGSRAARDEAKLELPLREVLAHHRDDAELRRLPCALRFVRAGLRRLRPDRRTPAKRISPGVRSMPRATFPGGGEGSGLEGCGATSATTGKTISSTISAASCSSYALGRSLNPPDEPMIQEMRGKLAENGYRFDSARRKHRHQSASSSTNAATKNLDERSLR